MHFMKVGKDFSWTMMDFPCSDLMEAARGQKHPYKSLRGQNNLEGVDLLKKSLPKVCSATSKTY